MRRILIRNGDRFAVFVRRLHVDIARQVCACANVCTVCTCWCVFAQRRPICAAQIGRAPMVRAGGAGYGSHTQIHSAIGKTRTSLEKSMKCLIPQEIASRAGGVRRTAAARGVRTLFAWRITEGDFDSLDARSDHAVPFRRLGFRDFRERKTTFSRRNSRARVGRRVLRSMGAE